MHPEVVLWVVPPIMRYLADAGDVGDLTWQGECIPGAYLNFSLQNRFVEIGLLEEVFSTSSYIWKKLYFLWLGCKRQVNTFF